jgi:hypothetical protein
MICFFGLFVLAPNRTAAQPVESQVSAALEQMHNWLGEGEKGKKWRCFLRSDQLLEELKKGTRADRRTLEEILEIYSGDTKGLTRRGFVKVRQALEAWLSELPKIGLADLPQAARDAKQEFAPTTADDVERARKKLDDAIDNLNGFLARGNEENTDRWKDYLRWSDMEEQLQAADGADPQMLNAIAARYYENNVGLELPMFTAVRVALRQYADAVLFSSNPKAQQYCEQYLDELAGLLISYESQSNLDDAVDIGRRVGWLERFGQAKELVTAIRQHHSHPNLFAQVSEELLRAGMDSNVDERRDVHDVILGTRVRSDAHVKGRFTLNLVPGRRQGLVDFGLDATITSDSVGRNRQVRIYSTGVTTVDATKRVIVDATGITDRPANARCQTSTTTRSIEGPALALGIASGRVERDKPLAEAISSQRAARRMERQIDNETERVVEKANERYVNEFRKPLLRRGGFPQILQFSTTEDDLHVRALEAGADQLAAPDRPPELTGTHDMMVRVHESFIANSSQAAIGGVTVTDEDVAEWAESLKGEESDESATAEEVEPWSIAFASERPIEAHFDNQRIALSVRAKQFASGDNEVKKRLRISATYDIEKTPQGVRLTRQGDVEVEFVGKERLKASEVALKTVVKKRFEALFEPQILSNGLKLPGQWEKAGELEFQEVYCDDGWLALAWRLPPSAARDE